MNRDKLLAKLRAERDRRAAQPPQSAIPAGTFWNGLPTPARRGSAIVADHPEAPLYWARTLVGQRIAVVEVVLDGVNYGGGIEYLDDREGQGWAKVTGGGSPRVGHSSVTVESGSFVPETPEMNEGHD